MLTWSARVVSARNGTVMLNNSATLDARVAAVRFTLKTNALPGLRAP
jgi:hypothetical protein